MRLRTIIPLVAATVLASFSQAPTTRELLNPEWGAVFPPASARRLLRQCVRCTPTPIGGTWNPSPAHVRRLEGLVSVLLNSQILSLGSPEALRPPAVKYY